MSHRDFPIVPTQFDPPTFSVAGHEFKALPEPPGGALADLLWTFQADTATKAAGLIRFIEGVLSDEAAEQFRLVIHSKDTIVPVQVLAEIAGWLVEEYTDRPTTPSSGLVAGSGSTPATPEGGADSPALTSVAPDSSS